MKGELNFKFPPEFTTRENGKINEEVFRRLETGGNCIVLNLTEVVTKNCWRECELMIDDY